MSHSTAKKAKTHATTRKPARAFAAKPPYNRALQLPKLIGLWPHELADCTQAGTARVVALLRKALRGERQRGIAGHWTYDINRHLALIESLREERARLKILEDLTASRSLPSARVPGRPRGEVLHLPLSKASAAGADSSGERSTAPAAPHIRRRQVLSG